MLEWKTSVKKATNQRGEILKYNINKLIITITFLICLFVIVLLKPSTKWIMIQKITSLVM